MMENTEWVVQDIKDNNRGKSNLIDRFIYFNLEKLRSGLWFTMTKSDTHKKALTVVNNEIERLRAELDDLDSKSLDNLKKDSLAMKYFNTSEDYKHGNWNNLIMILGKYLETEYTQNEPRISTELLIWQNS